MEYRETNIPSGDKEKQRQAFDNFPIGKAFDYLQLDICH